MRATLRTARNRGNETLAELLAFLHSIMKILASLGEGSGISNLENGSQTEPANV